MESESMKSESRRKWSRGEVETAIKVAFMMRSQGKLRYTDLQRALDEPERPMTPKTLATAIRSLKANGEIVVALKTGREIYYALAPPKPEEISSLAQEMDAITIRDGSSVGMSLHPEEGWSYYGLPIELQDRLSPKIKEEARKFQAGMDRVLDDELERIIKETIKRTGGRLSPADKQKGERAIRHIYENMMLPRRRETESVSVAAAYERLAPGILYISRKKLKGPVPWEQIKTAEYLAKASGISDDEIRRQISEATGWWNNLSTLVDGVRRQDRERSYARIIALFWARWFLCAVVR